MEYDWLNLFKTIAPILSNAASGSALGKMNEANALAQQNQNATSRYQAMVNASRLQNVEQPMANLKQAGAGSLMSTWKPMSVTPASVPYGSNTNGAVMPSISGGPSITPEMRQTGEAVSRSALQRQLGGNKIDTSLFPSDEQLGLGKMPGSSWLDKILGYGSLGSGLLGAFGNGAMTAGGIPAMDMGAATPTAAPVSTEAKNLFPIGGGGPGADGKSGLDLLSLVAQLNDFGLGPDATYLNDTMKAPEDPNFARRYRRLTRRA